jgi:RNA polymerase sigma factor (sigma-70 family)
MVIDLISFTSMQSRRDIVELFSTFIQFKTEYSSVWVVDTRLRRSMQHCLNNSPDSLVSESFWVLYWYNIWLTSSASLVGQHLSAYLQEPCYWAAQEMVKRFTSVQYKLPDYFQSGIAEVNTVLKRFNPSRGASLKTYAGIVFPSLLRDILRQRQEADLCTNWTLLRKISKKRLVEALQNIGLSAVTIAQYRLAWACFNAIYIQPAADQIKPDQQLWAAAAALYNTERLNQLSASSTVDAEAIEQWLTDCVTAVRTYLHPPIASLNAPKPEQSSGELQDDLAIHSSESLLTEMIAQEEEESRHAQQAQVHSVLTTALEKLQPESQELMRLYYQQGLTQQQIMQKLNMSQASVSRRLTKAREALLTTLVQWSQEELDISPTPTLIKDMSMALNEWLLLRYSESGLMS